MDRPVKVLHVVPDMAYGGVEKVVINYFEQIDHERFSFDFVTHGGIEEYHKDITTKGSKIFYLKTIGKTGYLGYLKQVSKNIDVKEYDIIHVHTGHLVGLYASIFKLLGANKIICHAHVSDCAAQSHKKFMPVFRILSNIFSDKRLACGEKAGKFCFGNSKYELLNNGINYKLYKNISETDIKNVKNELNISDNDFVVGHVGHFSETKNHKFIVELAKKYSEAYPNSKFVLVGDGPLRSEIEDLVREINCEKNIIFTGVRDDVPVLMTMFDVFILPSFHEGIPVVGIEAQAASTDCIFSENIDTSVCLVKEKCCFLTINDGVDVWAKEIEKIRNASSCNKPDIYKILCEKGYEVSASAYRLFDVYNDLISNIK